MYDEETRYAQSFVDGVAYEVWICRIGVGGNRFTLWGPDVEGRHCRMGVYFDLHSAMETFRLLTIKTHTA